MWTGADALMSILPMWELTSSSARAFLGAPHAGCYPNMELVMQWGREHGGKQGPSVAKAMGLLVPHNGDVV